MLLGRKEEEIEAGFGSRTPLSCAPLLPHLYSGNTALSDIGVMGSFLSVLLPRLSTCEVSLRSDWTLLAIGAQYAQVIGSRHFVKYISWYAAMNAHRAADHYERCLCLLARMPGGDVKLHTLLPYLNDNTPLGYHTSVRLGEEAYWRGDIKMLDAAIERATCFPDAASLEERGRPIMEMLLLQACRDRLEYGTVNLADMLSHLQTLDETQRRVYELDTMHLFLSNCDPATIGMIVQGFGLLRDPAAEALPSVHPE